LGREIQQALDAKTNPWGVSILSVEITDIIIPKELEDSLSKQAQAEREKESRIILGAAEVEIAKKFREASAEYAKKLPKNLKKSEKIRRVITFAVSCSTVQLSKYAMA
jgi:regulator of protease activity HflC (stomatin/prohibitin superfamily)